MSPGDQPADILAAAKALQGRGDLAGAEAAYGRFLALEPENAEALNNLGNVLRALRRQEEAVNCLQRALRAKPDHPAILSNLGLALGDLGRHEEAAECQRRAVAADPGFAAGHNNLGLALKELGRLADAQTSYRRAIALKPDFAEALNNLGNVLRAEERLEEAVAAYRRAIEIRPDYADALYNLANALRDSGAFAAAEAAYAAALACNPDFAQALANLGNLLTEGDRESEALTYLTRAAELNSDDAEAHSNLGNALRKTGRLEAAMASYQRALVLRPDFAGAWSNRGNALRELGRFEEALQSYRRAVDLEPGLAAAWSNLGSLHQEVGRLGEAMLCFDRALEADPTEIKAHVNRIRATAGGSDPDDLRRMESLNKGPKRLSVKERCFLHFALGRAYEDLGRFDEAFLNMVEANCLVRSSIAYDEARARENFAGIAQSALAVSTKPRTGFGFETELPIFIVGFPRSGTTLTEQILASHPEVYGAGELSYVGDLLSRLEIAGPPRLEYPASMPFVRAETFDQLGRTYAARLTALAPAARRITDKMPENYRFLGLIRMILPRAKVLHIQRSPLDVCVSCFSTLFARGHHFAYDLGELGRYYAMYLDLMAHWRAVLGEGAMLDVRYEDLVEDLEGQTRRILDYCGLPWDDRCLSFHETKRPVRTASVVQVRRPLYRSSVGRWRHYEKHLGPLVAALGPAATVYPAPGRR